MPVAKVYRPETHVPDDLLMVPEIIFKHNILTDDIRDSKKLTREARRQQLANAKRLTQSLRKLLRLNNDQMLVAARLDSYVEHDETHATIPTAGALVARPLVRERDGTIAEQPTIWIDNDHRPLPEADITFAGGIALAKAALGGGWHVHRGSNPNGIAYQTPRDEMLASEGLATVTPIRPYSYSPIGALPLVQPGLAPTGTGF